MSITASSSQEFIPDEPDSEFSQNNYLLFLLSNTIYSEDKKRHYESIIEAGITLNEFQNLKWVFTNDQRDNITMGSGYGQHEIKFHLSKLR